jgi:arylsulfatase A-like enzyme
VAAGCGPAPYAPPDGRWNVLVLVPDTIRADRISAAGYPKPTTPALDALAHQGVLFTQAISAAPRTWQSFTSILTGLYPPHHGVRHIGDHPLPPDTPSLGSTLTGRGYETAAFDPMAFLPRVTQGKHFGAYLGSRPGDAGNKDEAILARVAEFVSRERERPFLAFVRLNGAHWPYNDDRWIDEFEACEGHGHGFNFGSYGIKLGRAGEGAELTNQEAFRRLIWTGDADEETRRHRIAHYDAEVRAVDEMIGALLDGMRSSGLLDRTIVLVTSDHGESFFEHGYHQHGPRLDDVVMRVPLILWLPAGHRDHRAGVRVDALVRTVDLYPTLLDALDLSLPEGLDGVSLLPVLRREARPELWAYGEAGRSFMGMDPERRLQGVEGKRRMIRTAGWKLVHLPDAEGGEDRLFDLRSDPGETEDVASHHPERVVALRALLDSILASERPRGPDRELTEEEIEELRELGYMQ